LARDYAGRTLIALGSGTINDLCKYASFISNNDYFLIPTAASMNGYLSAFASLKFDGQNKSVKTHLPKNIFINLTIIREAPVRLLYAGLGDLFCSVNTLIEWQLGSIFAQNGYDESLREKITGLEDKFLDQLELNKLSDTKISSFMKLILYSGLVMTIAGGSYPASQSEHIFTHSLEILYPRAASQLLHGEKVAFFTKISLRIWEKLLSIDNLFERLDEKNYHLLYKEVALLELDLPANSLENCYKNKVLNLKQIKKSIKNEKRAWNIFRSNVVSALGNSKYYSRVKVLDIVTAHLEQVLLSNLRIENAIKISPFIRDRFTIADLYVLTANSVEDLIT